MVASPPIIGPAHRREHSPAVIALARTSHAIALAFLIAMPSASFAAETLETVAKSAAEWVKLRVEATRLETSWREERTLVEAMVTALDERAAAAEDRRELVRTKTAKDREELDGLRAQIEADTVSLRTFDARLKELTARLIAMRPALPPRLSEALEMTFRSLANTELPPGERMQFAMTVLNRCAQFDRSIVLGEDVVSPDGGAPAKSLEVIYWGLSHGYALDRAGGQAWVGAPEDGRWRWESKPDAFKGVAQLLAIANDKADPEMVIVPATVTRSIPAEARN
jgi:hypothetical protein